MKLLKCLFAFVALLLLGSCSRDNDYTSTGNGILGIAMSINKDVVSQKSIDGVDLYPEELGMDCFSITLSSADGKYSKKWLSYAEFPVNGVYRAGDYCVEAEYGSIEDEGFEKPYFYGTQAVSLKDGSNESLSLECHLGNSVIITTYTEKFTRFFSDYSIDYHSSGKGFLTVEKNDNRPLFIHPGPVSVFPSVTKSNGMSAVFDAGTILNAEPQHLYHVTFDVVNDGANGQPNIVVLIGDRLVEGCSMVVTDEVMSSPNPGIISNGFDSDRPMEVVEGIAPIKSVYSEVESKAGLKNLMLSTNIPVLLRAGIPAEFDLLAASAEQRMILSTMGVKVTGLWDGMAKSGKIDFTGLLSKVNDLDSAEGRISLVAVDYLNKSSSPSVLSILFKPIELTAAEIAPVALGCEQAEVRILSATHGFDGKIVSFQGKLASAWENLRVIDWHSNDDGSISYLVSLPSGKKDVQLKVFYNGVEKTVAVIPRSVPAYTLEADPLATVARFRVVCEDSKSKEAITENLVLKVGDEKVRIIERRSKDGILVISGLTPSTSYQIYANALPDNPEAGYERKSSIRTEGMQDVPDGDFEDAKHIEKIENFPQGGRYSQTNVSIFNRQNYWSYNLYLPKKYWSTVNDKTFCRNAKNKNTWYMQLSAHIVGDCHSGNKAMKVTSVGWDVSGESIADYSQSDSGYLPYNPNVPNVAHRAVGKLFLGDYTYHSETNEETYNEGVSFSKRPRALNGYYKYLPAFSNPNDKGYVKIELVKKEGGEETVVAFGERQLQLSPDYVSFSVPIDYPHFGLKPTHLKILFASSTDIGDINHETSTVVTDIDLSNSYMRGSELWIDNLSFTY